MEITEVKTNLNRIVRYRSNRAEYTQRLTACILRKYNNKFCYFAELLDKNNNSVIIVPLEKVEAEGN